MHAISGAKDRGAVEAKRQARMAPDKEQGRTGYRHAIHDLVAANERGEPRAGQASGSDSYAFKYSECIILNEIDEKSH